MEKLSIKDVIKKIKSMDKPYELIGMSQSQFSYTCSKAEKGLLKNDTLDKFFSKFGYEVSVEVRLYEKK